MNKKKQGYQQLNVDNLVLVISGQWLGDSVETQCIASLHLKPVT